MTENKENMQPWIFTSTAHQGSISAECKTQTGGERTIDLYLKPVKLSCAPRKRNTAEGTSVAQQRHLPPSWGSA